MKHIDEGLAPPLGLIIGMLLGIMLIHAHPARGAPPEGADMSLAPWYQGLKQPDTGVGCCSVADCRPVDSRVVGDHYEALLDGEWTPIPADKILDREPNPTGRAVACWTPWAVLCFVRPMES